MKHRLKDALPGFYDEIKAGFQTGESCDDLNVTERANLVRQLEGLFITGCCRCDFPDCGSFRVSRNDDSTASGEPRYSHTIDIQTRVGEVLVDLDHDNRIIGFEVVPGASLRSQLAELEVGEAL